MPLPHPHPPSIFYNGQIQDLTTWPTQINLVSSTLTHIAKFGYNSSIDVEFMEGHIGMDRETEAIKDGDFEGTKYWDSWTEKVDKDNSHHYLQTTHVWCCVILPHFLSKSTKHSDPVIYDSNCVNMYTECSSNIQ